MQAYHEAPFRQALATLDHQQHQLCLRSIQVKAHQPKCQGHVHLIKTTRTTCDTVQSSK
jgi:hypothetical protein